MRKKSIGLAGAALAGPVLTGPSLVGPVLMAGLALSAPVAAWAQFAAPVALPQGTQGGGAQSAPARSAAEQASTPSPTIKGYEPATLDGLSPPQAMPEGAGGREDGARAPDRRPSLPPLNEFEAYVSTISGKPLRRFGAELLLPGARDFTTPPTTAIPADYRLNPGDEVQLGLAGSVQASSLRLTIDSEGRIFIPRVGAVVLGGVRYGDAHGVVERAVARQYRNFTLDVTVTRLRGISVYVTGFAAHPGSYTANSLSTLVTLVMAAGGPASGGSFRSIQLRRGGRLLSDFDLYDLLLKGDRSGDMLLQNGDVIYVAPVGEEVAVIGSVNREAIFELAPGETLTDALLYAGGANSVADTTRLMLFNGLIDGNADTAAGAAEDGWREIPASRAATWQARRGDVLRVLSGIGIARPLRRQPVLVTLSGEVAKPGRYYVSPGTRMADVIAQAGGLTADAFPYASVITRESVKQQQRLSYDRAISDVELSLTSQPVTSVNRAQLVQPANIALVRSIVDQLRRREPDGRLVFDLPVDAKTLPGDLVLENEDSIHIPSRPVTVGVFGAVPSPASFAYRANASIEDFVRAAGGIQKIGDKDEVFVVRANGTVLAGGRKALRARALPGDLVYVPIEASRGEFWARLRDITGSLFGGMFGLATVKAAVD